MKNTLITASAVVALGMTVPEFSREFSRGPDEPDLDFNALVVTGRKGVRQVHAPNPRAEARKRQMVAEMQARRAEKRKKS